MNLQLLNARLLERTEELLREADFTPACTAEAIFDLYTGFAAQMKAGALTSLSVQHSLTANELAERVYARQAFCTEHGFNLSHWS